MQKLLLILSIFVLSCSKTDNKIMELKIKNIDINILDYQVEKSFDSQIPSLFIIRLFQNGKQVGYIGNAGDVNSTNVSVSGLSDIVYGLVTIDESNNISVSATSQKGSHLHLHNY